MSSMVPVKTSPLVWLYSVRSSISLLFAYTSASYPIFISDISALEFFMYITEELERFIFLISPSSSMKVSTALLLEFMVTPFITTSLRVRFTLSASI